MKNFILSLLFLFSFSAFSQTTHSFTFDCDHDVNVGITIGSGDKIELTNGCGDDSYTIEYLVDGEVLDIINWPDGTGTKLVSDITEDCQIKVRNNINYFLIINVTISTASVTSVSEVKFNVYPNPFVDYVNIDGLVQKVSVFDLNGKLIFSDTPNSFNTKIDLSQLEGAIYIVEVNGMHRLKIVKE
jgi:hypothetical protein